MFPRLFPTTREIEADQNLLETDTYTSTGDVTSATALTLSDPGRDSVRLPLADIEDATYSKRPSGKFKFSTHSSHLCEFC